MGREVKRNLPRTMPPELRLGLTTNANAFIHKKKNEFGRTGFKAAQKNQPS